MASRKPSIDSKKIIYENAKKLFYKKGYRQTSYNEISETANLNPAMLKYHFGSKKEIAALIYKEIVLNLYNAIANVLKTSEDIDIVYLINELCFFKLVKTNLNFQRFYLDLCKERIINDYTKETTFLMIQKYLFEKKCVQSKSQIQIATSISVASQSELINDYFSGTLKTDFDTVVDVYIELMFHNLALDKFTIKKKMELSKKIISKYNIVLNNAFEIHIIYDK